MTLKKKEFFLSIFLILLQSCSGGRIGNFLESSFNDFEKISQEDLSQKLLKNKKVVSQENNDLNNKNYEKIKKVEKIEKVEKVEQVEQVEKPKSVLQNKKDKNLEKIQNKRNYKIGSSSKKRKIDPQSYKIIFILKDVDPKDPTEELSSILSNSEVNFDIEKIERILDSKNKSMNKN